MPSCLLSPPRLIPQVLRRLNFHESSVTKAVAAQGVLAGTAYLLTYLLLALRKPKFEPVFDPAEQQGKAERKAARAAAKRRGSGGGALPAAPVVSVVRGGGVWGIAASGSLLPVGPKIFF